MRLVAVYIKEHKFLFNNESQVLNLGGKYFYDFESIIDRAITIYRKENKNYIDDFYSKGIISTSGIVGANGTGKTSLLKIIHKSYLEDTSSIFVYEKLAQNEIEYFIDNRIGTRNENGGIIEESKPIVKFFENIDSCDKNSDNQDTTQTFTTTKAREWYYFKFKESTEWKENNESNNETLDWSNGEYSKLDDFEVIEFPLIEKNTTSQGSLNIAAIKKNTPLVRIAFIKTSNDSIII